jgi:hypothetical protein
LALFTNTQLVWKKLATDKHSSLFGLVISDEEKSFFKLTPVVSVNKLFFAETNDEAN